MLRTTKKGVTYLITGIDRNGKKFKIKTSNAIQAMGINLHREKIWMIKNGKRTLLESVWN